MEIQSIFSNCLLEKKHPTADFQRIFSHSLVKFLCLRAFASESLVNFSEQPNFQILVDNYFYTANKTHAMTNTITFLDKFCCN